MEYISSIDKLFLRMETQKMPMHIGGFFIFDYPESCRDKLAFLNELMTQVRQNPEIVPRHNQFPTRSLRSQSRWYWHPVEALDFEYHIKYYKASSMQAAQAYVGEYTESHFDKSKPLWQFHFIEGFSKTQFAVFIKIHHSVTDAISARHAMMAILSNNPDHQMTNALGQLENISVPNHRQAINSSDGAEEKPDLQRRLEVIKNAIKAPIAVINDLRKGQDGLAPNPLKVPQTLLNGVVSSQRVFSFTSVPLDRLQRLAQHERVTVNDVVLAITGEALRRYLSKRGALPDASLYALVPVSIHPQGEPSQGNKICGLFSPLATDVANYSDRLKVISKATAKGKTYLQDMPQFMRVGLIAAALAPLSLAQFPVMENKIPMPANVLLSNFVLGKDPLYLNGARLRSLFPVSILLNKLGLNITVIGYDGALNIGMLGCKRMVPDVDVISNELVPALEALESAHGLETAPRPVKEDLHSVAVSV